jgi:hypothetical protein
VPGTNGKFSRPDAEWSKIGQASIPQALEHVRTAACTHINGIDFPSHFMTELVLVWDVGVKLNCLSFQCCLLFFIFFIFYFMLCCKSTLISNVAFDR